MGNNKKNFLLVDNPIDLMAVIFLAVAIIVLTNLSIVFLNSKEFPGVATYSIKYLQEGGLSVAGMFAVRILFHTKKGKNTPIIGNQFDKRTLRYIGFATGSYFAIQIVVLTIQNMRLFQVTAYDVYAFFLSAAVIEEVEYRGLLVMFTQMILARLFKAKSESQMMLVNIFTSIISGVFFMYAHARYSEDIFAMTLTFLGGCSQAWWYIQSRNLFVVMLSHGSVNYSASGSLIQQLNKTGVLK